MLPLFKKLFKTMATMDLKKFAEGSGEPLKKEKKEKTSPAKKPRPRKKPAKTVVVGDEDIDVPELTDEQLETCLKTCITGLDLVRSPNTNQT